MFASRFYAFFIEGPVEIPIYHLLKCFIFELQLFTLEQFNTRLAYFDYGHFEKDKPATILRDHFLDDNSLSAQLFTIVHMLLLIIIDWIQYKNLHFIEHINV